MELSDNKQYKKIFKVLKNSVLKVKAYQDLLSKKNIDIKKIISLNDFKHQIPILTKDDLFPIYKINDLCINGSIEKVKSIYTSSGFQGNYSYGISSAKDQKKISKSIDKSIDNIFNTKNKKVLIISCLPMGVKVYTNFTLAETSVRSDMALEIFKKFSEYYDKVIIVGDPNFIKKIIEEGIEKKINWEKSNSSFILGGDWFPESFREYLEKLTGIITEPKQERLIVSSYGIAEIDLNLFFETPYTISIRKLACKNNEFKETLFKNTSFTTPMCFHYFPNKIFLETELNDCQTQDLLFTKLSIDQMIPLIRYNSKDIGGIINQDQIREILNSFNYMKFLPDLNLPLVYVNGRYNSSFKFKEFHISLENIKEILYKYDEITKNITGQFRINQNKNYLTVEIQLNKYVSNKTIIKSLIEERLNKSLEKIFQVKLFNYNDYPYNMEINYEKKFIHH